LKFLVRLNQGEPPKLQIHQTSISPKIDMSTCV
jgi:hypothetical protein